MKNKETLEEAAWELAKQKFEEKCDYKPNLSNSQDLLVVSSIQKGVLIGAKWQINKQDEFTLGFLHWYNTSQECETYLRRNYPKNITMNGEHYKKVLEINKELLEMYKNTLPR